ncbi:MAG: MHYT domain-containing protein, partial [Limisphaerales bacterium]
MGAALTLPGSNLVGSYYYPTVILSIVIAVGAGLVALALPGRVTAAQGVGRVCWLAGGGTAMALGIWAMDFTGMLAFQLGIPIWYYWPTLLLSFVPGLFASVLTLWAVSRWRLNSPKTWLSSLLIAAGITGLHYTAMASIRCAGVSHYSFVLVAVCG